MGNVISVPLPTSVLIPPAAIPAAKIARAWRGGIELAPARLGSYVRNARTR